MILRYSLLEKLPFLFALLAANLLQTLADPFDCKPVIDKTRYDFTSLSKEHQLNRTRSTPPSTTIDSLTFDLCEDLVPKDGVSDHDRCPFGTRACLTQINVKNKDERIISVVPLALSSKEASITVSTDRPKHLNIIFHGSDYPEKSTDTSPSVQQSFNLTLWCEPDQTKEAMEIKDYDGSQLKLEYFGAAGCPAGLEGDDGGDDKPDNTGKEQTGSGIGWFFFMLLLAFLAYFGIGAYYNYSTYGARGLDLIPHRDFWQEVPYMLRDVASHLCSAAKPRSRTSRNGYIQV
ncbi:autophagy-related protein 27 [Coprinopsis sp. MPI-PUGE-AT-0042]|nr:autophagy-related protein 27 [Coprinopsis sp. MPI-PUGE-AT-0042]